MILAKLGGLLRAPPTAFPRTATAWARVAALAVAPLLTAGCVSTNPGPYPRDLLGVPPADAAARYRVVDVDETVVRRLSAGVGVASFAEIFPETQSFGATAQAGDVIAVTIWEAPPAMLFSGQATTSVVPQNAPANGVTLPEQVVDSRGQITVPYVGNVRAAGRESRAIADEIVARLRRKANQPQAVVRVVRNVSEVVTVIGDVAQSTRLPLSAQRERVLDALAAAGGVKQDVNRVSIQLTRGQRVAIMPLSTVLSDPRQNVVLRPGDVVTALYRTSSFTVLGATGRNDEVDFESTGITLAQALGRAGGLVDNRADPRGVFVFRLENPAAVADAGGGTIPPRVGDRLPTIYRVDLRRPDAFFIAQQFPLQSKDVLYVSNAGYVDLQRFVTLIGAVLGPAATGAAIGNTNP